MLDYQYHAACTFEDGSEELLDLEVRGWADKARLAQTRKFSLIPKEGESLPVVSIHIPERAKPVFKTRVFGFMSVQGGEGQSLFRCYAVGWKRGRFEHLVWVLPTGDIEVGKDPTMADALVTSVKAELQRQQEMQVSG